MIARCLVEAEHKAGPPRSWRAGAFASPTLRSVVAADLCSGCGACAAIAPSAVRMALDGEGFLRPRQERRLGRAEEERIARACPGRGLELRTDGRPDHPLWGPVLAVRTGHATDPEVRRIAASGGALSAVLLHLLASGKVDKIVQTAAAAELPTGNAAVATTTRDGVLAAAGSRYAPSAAVAALPSALADGSRVAFVGKPCDVAAVHAMAANDLRIACQVPVLISFFCAGVPGLSGARTILAAMGVAEEDVLAFRYRGNGWPGLATARLRDGSERRMSYADSWGGILSKRLQQRCKLCPDGTGAFADLVFADAWEADADGDPLFEEAEGVSLIVSRTAKGEALLAAAVAGGALTARPYDIARVAAIQPGQTRKRRFLLARLAAMRALGRTTPRYRGFHLLRNARAAGLGANIRQFLGTARRQLLPGGRAG